ncbi:hypothetical protein [Amycolatopsis sp. NPDC059021]|uniref:hypothetical protein n=1 Tax=Amycolatopsis sp. NPDC059021 TaxID=3346704 RepID=UPI00366D5C68
MSPEEDLAALKHKLAGLERENGDRMYLVEQRAAKAVEESREAGDKLRRETDEALTKLLEQKRRAEAAGGWVTESTVGDKVDDENDFGFEEDETENERRAGYRAADAPPPAAYPAAPPPPPSPPVPPPAVTPAPAAGPGRGAGRHRRPAHSDDDDFANTDWLAT